MFKMNLTLYAPERGNMFGSNYDMSDVKQAVSEIESELTNVHCSKRRIARRVSGRACRSAKRASPRLSEQLPVNINFSESQAVGDNNSKSKSKGKPRGDRPRRDRARVKRSRRGKENQSHATYFQYPSPVQPPRYTPSPPSLSARDLTEYARDLTESARDLTESARDLTESARDLSPLEPLPSPDQMLDVYTPCPSPSYEAPSPGTPGGVRPDLLVHTALHIIGTIMKASHTQLYNHRLEPSFIHDISCELDTLRCGPLTSQSQRCLIDDVILRSFQPSAALAPALPTLTSKGACRELSPGVSSSVSSSVSPGVSSSVSPGVPSGLDASDASKLITVGPHSDAAPSTSSLLETKFPTREELREEGEKGGEEGDTCQYLSSDVKVIAELDFTASSCEPRQVGEQVSDGSCIGPVIPDIPSTPVGAAQIEAADLTPALAQDLTPALSTSNAAVQSKLDKTWTRLITTKKHRNNKIIKRIKSNSELKHAQSSSELKHGQSNSELKHAQSSSELKHGKSSSELKHGQSSSELKHGQSSSEILLAFQKSHPHVDLSGDVRVALTRLPLLVPMVWASPRETLIQ